jgi:hypothetical protein
VNFGTSGWANNVALGDLSGLGKLDAVALCQIPDGLSVYHNVSTPGSFTASSLVRVDFTPGYNPDGQVVADLDGDGRPDLVFANTYDGNIYVFLNTVPCTNLPAIISQPQDTLVAAHSTATFGVSALWASSYQWLFNGSNLLNATSSQLTISNVSPSQLGRYSVIITSGSGSVTSSVANLYLYPTLVTPFTGTIAILGQNTTLSVGALGSGSLSYQWYDNGVAILNATNSTLNFPSIQFTNAGLYSVVVSSYLGSATNAPAQVAVTAAGLSFGLYPGITVNGTVGYTYYIQSISDLANTNGWTTVGTVILSQPVQLWVDTNLNAALPANPRRLYRVTLGP